MEDGDSDRTSLQVGPRILSSFLEIVTLDPADQSLLLLSSCHDAPVKRREALLFEDLLEYHENTQTDPVQSM